VKLGHARSICKIRVLWRRDGTQKMQPGPFGPGNSSAGVRFPRHSEAVPRLLRMSRMDQDEEDLFLMQQPAPGNTSAFTTTATAGARDGGLLTAVCGP